MAKMNPNAQKAFDLLTTELKDEARCAVGDSYAALRDEPEFAAKWKGNSYGGVMEKLKKKLNDEFPVDHLSNEDIEDLASALDDWFDELNQSKA